MGALNIYPLDYQPPISGHFLSEQIIITIRHQPTNDVFLSEQISTSHQPAEQSHPSCSCGLSAISQRYFFVRTN
jgi:hypothetical protein